MCKVLSLSTVDKLEISSTFSEDQGLWSLLSSDLKAARDQFSLEQVTQTQEEAK